MERSIFQLTESINRIYQQAYEVYQPLVEDLCRPEVSEEELSHFLDYLLDFACDAKILGLYKRVCRRNLLVYLNCIKFLYRSIKMQDVMEEHMPTRK